MSTNTVGQDCTPVTENSPLVETRDLSSYYEFWQFDGTPIDYVDPIMHALDTHRSNGYAVIKRGDIRAMFGVDPGVFMCVVYHLHDQKQLDRLIVHEDHIIYAVKRELSAEVLAIQNRRDDEWLASYEAAHLFGSEAGE